MVVVNTPAAHDEQAHVAVSEMLNDEEISILNTLASTSATIYNGTRNSKYHEMIWWTKGVKKTQNVRKKHVNHLADLEYIKEGKLTPKGSWGLRRADLDMRFAALVRSFNWNRAVEYAMLNQHDEKPVIELLAARKELMAEVSDLVERITQERQVYTDKLHPPEKADSKKVLKKDD